MILWTDVGDQMQPTGESTIQIRRRVIVVLILLPLFTGFAAFTNIARDPRFRDIRSLDVVRLIAIGACWELLLPGWRCSSARSSAKANDPKNDSRNRNFDDLVI